MSPEILRFSQELAAKVGKAALSKNCSKGVFVFREGEKYLGPWLLLKGAVVLVKSSTAGKEQLVREVEPGEVFAEVPLFKAFGWYPITARCVASCELHLLPADVAKASLQANPDLSWLAACALAGRLSDFRETFFDLTLADAQKRLLRYLVRRLEGRPNPELGVVRLGINHQDLALLLGIRPESLSRALTELEEAGKLKRLSRQTVQLFPKNIPSDSLEW